jgi:hypothetical protein
VPVLLGLGVLEIVLLILATRAMLFWLASAWSLAMSVLIALLFNQVILCLGMYARLPYRRACVCVGESVHPSS